MNAFETALRAARARAEGPLPAAPGASVPDGMLRLVEPDGAEAWWVPVGPDEVSPAALRDLRLALPSLDHPNEAGRVLAVCLRCCWTELTSDPWPGRRTGTEAVRALLAELLPTRLPQVHTRFVVEALRQLHDSSWLRWDEPSGAIRLGPRVAAWSRSELDVLRELCRTMPEPPG